MAPKKDSAERWRTSPMMEKEIKKVLCQVPGARDGFAILDQEDGKKSKMPKSGVSWRFLCDVDVDRHWRWRRLEQVLHSLFVCSVSNMCSLREAPSSVPHVEAFYQKKVFFWHPLLFYKNHVPQYPCALSSKDDCWKHNVSVSGVTQGGPRRVALMSDDAYLLGVRLTCSDCPANNNSFDSYHKKVLDRLPDAISNEFPFYLTHQHGVAKEVLERLRRVSVSHQSFEDIAAEMTETRLLPSPN